MNNTHTKFVAALVLAAVALALAAVSAAGATQPTDDNIQICHGTNAVENPYTTQTTDPDSLGSGNGGDHSTHTGPIASTTAIAQALKDAHIDWGDIIPAHGDFPGLNWTPEGIAIYENGCALVPETTPTPSPTPEVTPSPIATPTTSPTPAESPTPTATPSGTPTPTEPPTNTPTPAPSATPEPSPTSTTPSATPAQLPNTGGEVEDDGITPFEYLGMILALATLGAVFAAAVTYICRRGSER